MNSFSVYSIKVGFGCFQPRTLSSTDKVKCATGDFEEAYGTSQGTWFTIIHGSDSERVEYSLAPDVFLPLIQGLSCERI